jgi:hypothetical protein
MYVSTQRIRRPSRGVPRTRSLAGAAQAYYYAGAMTCQSPLTPFTAFTACRPRFLLGGNPLWPPVPVLACWGASPTGTGTRLRVRALMAAPQQRPASSSKGTQPHIHSSPCMVTRPASAARFVIQMHTCKHRSARAFVSSSPKP